MVEWVEPSAADTDKVVLDTVVVVEQRLLAQAQRMVGESGKLAAVAANVELLEDRGCIQVASVAADFDRLDLEE